MLGCTRGGCGAVLPEKKKKWEVVMVRVMMGVDVGLVGCMQRRRWERRRI